MDPHSFYVLDPDPHSICGSGSRRDNLSNKNRKKARNVLITAILFNFKSKFAHSSIVSYFRVIFFLFYDYRTLFTSLFLTKFVKLDPDSHSFYLLDTDPQKSECGSTALVLTIILRLFK